ncbi:M3 family metallopeptidase, partial [Novosphingobium lubricantis]
MLSRTLEEALELHKQICLTFTPADARKRYAIRAINSVMKTGDYDLATIMQALRTIPAESVTRARLMDYGIKETCIANVLIKYIIEITNTTRQPALAQLENRELRQQIWDASAYRGTKGETDNRPIVARLAQIRAERAKLLGFDTHAHFSLDQSMAKNPKAVMDMLGSMAPTVVENTKKEAAAIQDMIKQTGGTFE